MSNSTSFFQQFTEEESKTFKETLHSFKDNFEGLFNNPSINLVLCFFYLGSIISWFGLLLVSWFEKTGQAGQFRTLINQLISRKLDWIVTLAGFSSVLQALRLLLGPMPRSVCQVLTGVQVFTSINICLMALSVSGARFTFAYIYKTIPVMDDDFWVSLINRVIMTWSALVTLAKHYTEEKVIITERICNGSWSDKDMELKPNPVAALVCVVTLLLHAVITIAIKVRKPVEDQGHKYKYRALSSDLASTLATIMTTGSMFLIGVNFLILTKTGTPDTLKNFPGSWLVHLYAPILPFVLTWAQCLSQYMKNPQLRKSVKRLISPDKLESVAKPVPKVHYHSPDQMVVLNV